MTEPVAVVAGGSRGLGLLIARDLVTRGYQVSICDRDAGELERARGWLSAPGQVHTAVCDVTDRTAVGRWLDEVGADLGPVEVAITVAGVIQVGPGPDLTLDHFDNAIDVMLRGPIHVARLVEPGMRERRSGRIGTITSVGGVVSPPHLLPYATSNFGAVGFSDGLVASLTGSGVTATTVVPGLMRTGSQDRALFTGDVHAEYSWFATAASLPLLSMDADRAARRIVDGVLAGQPLVVLTPLTW
ncbi:MAG TPA: SDR family oxidoreductase, partial [Propionibacteriaceae bacterium]|nr:SDR family oxidoreductase [Propionibacteriaceae bacterium]